MKKKKLFSGPRTAAGRLAADMLRRYYTHDVARDSAALTYYLLFAIFPLLIFISTLLGLLDLDIAYITSVLEPLLPVDVVDVIQSYLSTCPLIRAASCCGSAWYSPFGFPCGPPAA